MTKYEFQYRSLYAKFHGGPSMSNLTSYVSYDANAFVTNSGVIGRQAERPHSEPEGSIEGDFDEEMQDEG